MNKETKKSKKARKFHSREILTTSYGLARGWDLITVSSRYGQSSDIDLLL